MRPVAKQLSDARKQILNVHPENLGFNTFVQMRSTLLGIMEICEQLYNLHFEETNMTTTTLKADTKAGEADYTNLDALLSVGDIDGELEKAKQVAETAYRQLVFDLAEGRRVDPAKMRTILFDASRTADEFKRHVSMVNCRRTAIADRVRADELAATLPKLKAEVDAAAAAVKKREDAYRKEISPLHAAHRLSAENFANCDINAKELRRNAVNTLNRTAGPDFLDGYKPLGNRAAAFEKKIHEAVLDARRAKHEMPEVEAAIAKIEGQILREETGGGNDVLIAQFNKQIEEKLARYDRLANSDKIVAELKAQKKAADEALAEYVKAGTNDPRNIRWDERRSAWAAV